jgi:hypothetical protein
VKTVIAYILLVFGAPVAIGAMVSMPIEMIVRAMPLPSKATIAVAEMINGGVNLVLAILLFLFLEVQVTWLLPLLLAFITTMWLTTRTEYVELAWQLGGIFIGWLVYWFTA